MTAIAATPAGANRPEFTPFPGLGRYFPNPTGALLYYIGNAISSVASAAWSGLTNTGERLLNLVTGDGWNTNKEVRFNEITKALTDLSNPDYYGDKFQKVAQNMKAKEFAEYYEKLKADGKHIMPNPSDPGRVFELGPDGTVLDRPMTPGELLRPANYIEGRDNAELQLAGQYDALTSSTLKGLKLNPNLDKMRALYYAKNRGMAEKFIAGLNGSPEEKAELTERLNILQKEWQKGGLSQAQKNFLVDTANEDLARWTAETNSSSRSAIVSFFHRITGGVFDSAGGRVSQASTSLPKNGKEACNLAADTMLINKLVDRNFDVADAYRVGVATKAVRSDTFVKNDTKLAKALGAKNVTYQSTDSFDENSIKALLDKGTWVKIALPGHFEVIYDYEKRDNQLLFKVHDPGFQGDTHISPKNWMPFHFVTEDGVERKEYSWDKVNDKQGRTASSIGYYK